LENKWLISNKLGNFSSNRIGAQDMVRGMAVKDGKMYFCDRTDDVNKLVVVDGKNGEMLNPIILAPNVFTTDKKGAAVSLAFPCNDIHVDNAGNILVSNMILNPANRFQVWNIDVATGNGVLVLDEVLNDYPDFYNASVRFDYFGVYGDVNDNAIIMAANGFGVADVYKWTITGGVIGEPENIPLQFSPYSVAATRILPISFDLFYWDSSNCHPHLFNMNGYDVDGINNTYAPAINTLMGTYTSNNGLAEFQIGDEYFFYLTMPVRLDN